MLRVPTRRNFVKLASTAALAAGTRPSFFPGSSACVATDAYPHAGDPQLRELAAAALDAAKTAGASYADVRFTLTRAERIHGRLWDWNFYQDDEHGAIGVRVIADGAWGFTSSPRWTKEEAARLGREATIQAQFNAKAGGVPVELDTPPPPMTGTWRTPILRDPFLVPLPEKLATMSTLSEDLGRMDAPMILTPGWGLLHRKQEKTFVSSTGTFVTQTLYRSHPSFGVIAQGRYSGYRTYDRLRPRAAGWEMMADPTLSRDLELAVDEAVRMSDAELVSPGRYDIVCDATAVAMLLARTIGSAGELDRALGYEANASGTSYLSPAEEAIGTYNFGTPLLNVTADRSRPEGCSTVRWDDDGVVPDTYPVVTNGVVRDYHTTRATAPSLAAWYAKQNRPVRSHGCSAGETALHVPVAQPPNLEMGSGREDTTFEDLVGGLENGLVIVGGSPPILGTPAVTMDRQQLNGEINGNMVYEVKKGKRTRFLREAEVLFRAPELWKSLQAIGGKRSLEWTGFSAYKGQPRQEVFLHAGAVPARFKQVAVTDRRRKA